jgi:hypothetical protein
VAVSEKQGTAQLCPCIIALLILGLVAAHALWYATESLTVDRGDAYADCFVLVAGQHFYEQGFARCHWLPVHQPGLLSQPLEIYTHYPPLPDWINALERLLFGWDNLFLFRLLPIICLISGYWAWYRLVCLVSSPWIALLALTFLASREIYSQLIDNIHGHSYHEALRLWGFYLIVRLAFKHNPTHSPGICEETERQPPVIHPGWVAGFSLLLFINAWSSYESILDLQIVLWGTLFWLCRYRPAVSLLPLLLAPVLAFVLQQALNLWAVGSTHLADIKDTLILRTSGGVTSSPMVTDNLWDYLLLLWERFNSLLGVPVWMLGFFVAGLFIKPVGQRGSLRYDCYAITQGPVVECEQSECIETGEGRGEVSNPLSVSPWRLILLLFIAGASWWIIFPSHTCIHYFTFRHITPAVALLLACATGMALNNLLLWKNCNWLQRILGLMIVVAALYGFSHQTLLRKESPIRTTPEDQVFASIQEKTQPDEMILTNWNRVPLVRAGTWRRSERATTIYGYEEVLAHQKTLFSEPPTARMFAYRIDRDHKQDPAQDPLYQYLCCHFTREEQGQWLLFDLVGKVE